MDSPGAGIAENSGKSFHLFWLKRAADNTLCGRAYHGRMSRHLIESNLSTLIVYNPKQKQPFSMAHPQPLIIRKVIESA
jgi:hypothetical protein